MRTGTLYAEQPVPAGLERAPGRPPGAPRARRPPRPASTGGGCAVVGDRLVERHPPVEEPEDRPGHRGRDGAAARRADGEEQLPVRAEDQGRRHRGERTLPRCGQVELPPLETEGVGDPGGGVEVVHLVVEQDPAARDHHARPELEVHGGGERHGVALRVDDRDVGGVARRAAGPGGAVGPARSPMDALTWAAKAADAISLATASAPGAKSGSASAPPRRSKSRFSASTKAWRWRSETRATSAGSSASRARRSPSTIAPPADGGGNVATWCPRNSPPQDVAGAGPVGGEVGGGEHATSRLHGRRDAGRDGAPVEGLRIAAEERERRGEILLDDPAARLVRLAGGAPTLQSHKEVNMISFKILPGIMGSNIEQILNNSIAVLQFFDHIILKQPTPFFNSSCLLPNSSKIRFVSGNNINNLVNDLLWKYRFFKPNCFLCN